MGLFGRSASEKAEAGREAIQKRDGKARALAQKHGLDVGEATLVVVGQRPTELGAVILAVFPDRLEFKELDKGFLNRGLASSIPLQALQTVSVQGTTPGLAAVVFAAGHQTLAMRLATGEAAAVRSYVEQAAAAARTTPSVHRPSQSDPVDALRSLGDLHAAGVLSDAEFEQKKAELLKRM